MFGEDQVPCAARRQANKRVGSSINHCSGKTSFYLVVSVA